ncbi:helix-turn-helix domain-containing protein [Kineococcus gynurae]|uniref:Helix-turn-helix domain-containing protein n=1 Tax=Kineococcus gynurae TaxID=452979 RepID=A0ABV5LSI0_9ACTN
MVDEQPAAENDPLAARLAGALKAARLDRGLGTAALARAAGVSRGSVLKLEAGATQPSAALLGRVCAPLGLTLSELFARVEETRADAGRLVRGVDAPVWTDPATGYRRRTLSPSPAGPVQLTEIRLPAGASVGYPAQAYVRLHQQVWVLEGTVALTEGSRTTTLGPGDCLELGPAADCTFANPGSTEARYLVVTAAR